MVIIFYHLKDLHKIFYSLEKSPADHKIDRGLNFAA